MMKVAINVVAILLFALWGYFVAADFRTYFFLRKKYKINFFLGLDQLKNMAEVNNDDELMREYVRLKKYKSRIFWVWLACVLCACIILFVVGMLSSQIGK